MNLFDWFWKNKIRTGINKVAMLFIVLYLLVINLFAILFLN